MLTLSSINYETIGVGTFLTAALGFMARIFISWWRNTGSKDSLTSEKDNFMDKLREEALKWEERHNELYKIHKENLELITLLKMQVAMMRMLLLSKGISEAELIAIGVMPHEIHGHSDEYHHSDEPMNKPHHAHNGNLGEKVFDLKKFMNKDKSSPEEDK